MFLVGCGISNDFFDCANAYVALSVVAAVAKSGNCEGASPSIGAELKARDKFESTPSSVFEPLKTFAPMSDYVPISSRKGEIKL